MVVTLTEQQQGGGVRKVGRRSHHDASVGDVMVTIARYLPVTFIASCKARQLSLKLWGSKW